MITPERIIARLEQLPTLSATAVRLTALARDERSSAADFEKVIRPDPAVTANLLRIVNSAYFGLRSRAETVRQAVTLLGLRRTAEVAAAAGFAPLLPARLPGYDVEGGAFWLHCVSVAVLAERLAGELAIPCPDLTFTAGLLHDLGKLAIGVFVSEHAGEILDGVRRDGRPFVAVEHEVLGTDHGEVGETIAGTWTLPHAVAQVARWHHAPSRAPEGPARSLVDLVHVADALAHSLGLGADAGELARAVDPGAEARLGIRPRRLERVAGQSLEEIRDLARAFAPAPGGGR